MLNYQIQSLTLTVLALAIRIADDVKATLSENQRRTLPTGLNVRFAEHFDQPLNIWQPVHKPIWLNVADFAFVRRVRKDLGKVRTPGCKCVHRVHRTAGSVQRVH